MGAANKALSFFSRKVIYGFDAGDNRDKACVVGVPLRENIRKINRDEARKHLGLNGKPGILCFGGSQGSEFLNKNFIKLVAELDEEFLIIHLTGKNNYRECLAMYEKIEKAKFIKDFYYDMQYLYSAADLIISRAGASTLAEISYYGIPPILIPYPAAGGHQKANALYFEERGAARVFTQDDFNFADFKLRAGELLFDDAVRNGMIANLAKIKLAVACDEFGENIGRMLK
jgi:UDP-N-acetylglucosamine--N-acetylmuramyl-(pentapeptide) pyrophosphoryl-undecaprenol N-acetylglucosamine transferase